MLKHAKGARQALARSTFWAQEVAKRHATFRVFREMQREQWLSTDRLRKIQQQRLRALLMTAATNVPYYRELFRAKRFDPATDTDLRQLPLLDKKIIRENLERLRNTHSKRVQRFSTGGSTGEPLTFYLGATRITSDVAARMRAESWFGVSIGDPEFAIWGSPIELTRQDRLRGLRDWILRTRLLSAFEMSPQVMTQYLDLIERQGCERIFGYPSSIALLCEHARSEHRDLRHLGVKTVFVTAEYLYDQWRTTIAETFRCPVANGYGGRDSGFVAHECPASGMHITADRLIVEIVDDHGQQVSAGESGEIVVTNLDTPEMPFIRYRTGDVGTLTARLCACGRSLPLLERIDGRKTDFIVAPDGRVMHGLSLIYALREIPGIENFRVTQKDLTRFELLIVRSSKYSPASEAQIRTALVQRLRTSVSIDIKYCERIQPTASGKTRHVISEVSPVQLQDAGITFCA